MGLIHTLVQVFFYFLIAVVFVSFIISWLPINPDNPVSLFLNRILRPLREPLDRRIPPIGFLNISFLILIWAINFTMQLILYALPASW